MGRPRSYHSQQGSVHNERLFRKVGGQIRQNILGMSSTFRGMPANPPKVSDGRESGQTKNLNRVYTEQINLSVDLGIAFSKTAGITYDAGDDSGGAQIHRFDIDSVTIMQLQSNVVDIRKNIVNSAGTNNNLGSTSAPFANLYIQKIIIDDDDDSDISATTDDEIVIKTGTAARLTIKNDTIEATNPLVFTTSDPLTGSQHGITQDANGTNINAASGKLITFSINLTGRLSMSNTSWGGQTGDDFRLFCVSSGNKAPINLEPVAGDPSTTENGDIWYNSTSGKFRVKEGGTAKDMI